MRTPRRKRLSFDLNLVDLCETGFWFCTECQLVTELVDKEGLGAVRCIHCGSLRTKFCPPVLDPITPKPEPAPRELEPAFSI